MASIAVNDDYIIATCGPKVLSVRFNEARLDVIAPPGIKGMKADTSTEDPANEDGQAQEARVVGVDISKCGKWLALCSNNKQLSLWNTHDWSLVANRPLVRSAGKIRFTPSGTNLIVADKTGDVYLFSVDNPSEKGKLILGHLSMLLDVVISQDEQFIITCDRDEKIRVSHFPNAYNIQSYCLGHKEFVSNIQLLCHCPSVLVSCSGDGTLRFWDYKNGTQLYLENCSEDILHYSKKDMNSEFVSYISKNSCTEDSSTILPVIYMSSCAICATLSFIGVCLNTFKGCVIYKVSGDVNDIECVKHKIVTFPAQSWAIAFSDNGLLWSLVHSEKEPLYTNYLNEDEQIVPVKIQSKMKTASTLVNNNWELFKHIRAPEIVNILYKRKFDNVQDYLQRKKARLGISH